MVETNSSALVTQLRKLPCSTPYPPSCSISWPGEWNHVASPQASSCSTSARQGRSSISYSKAQYVSFCRRQRRGRVGVRPRAGQCSARWL